MKVIAIHADSITYKPIKKAIKSAEDVKIEETKVNECLVVLTAVEKRDENLVKESAKRLAEETSKIAEQVKKGKLNINEINDSVFKILKYIAIFPGGVNKLADQDGNILPDCFLIPPNSTALDFAYKIHSDLGDNFIRAIDVKNKRAVGKDYKLKHRDVMEIIYRK